MGLNGGGYTFIDPQYLTVLTNDEVQAMFTDKQSFLMRARCTDSMQPYGILEQLPQYKYTNSYYLLSLQKPSCR